MMDDIVIKINGHTRMSVEAIQDIVFILYVVMDYLNRLKLPNI